MKKLMKTSLMAALLAFSFNPLYAGGNHDHSGHGHSHNQEKVTKSYAQNKATKEIKSLVQRNKLDASWLKIPISNTKQKKYNNKMEWVISYENKTMKDEKKQNLYVFVNLYGKITGINHSGN